MAKAPAKTKNALVATLGGVTVELPVAGYKLQRRVTTPLISLTHNTKIMFKPEGELVLGDATSTSKGFDKPMTVLPVIDLSTGESVTLIVPTVLESALKRVPGGYVGKSFLAIQGPKMPNKQYFQVELFEVSKDGSKVEG